MVSPETSARVSGLAVSEKCGQEVPQLQMDANESQLCRRPVSSTEHKINIY